MKITIRKAVEDLEKIVPLLNALKPFQHLKTMASTVAIGTQGIEVDGLMKDYEAYIKEEIIKTHPMFIVDTADVKELEPGSIVKVTQEEMESIKKNPDKLVDALRKKLQEK
jgi:hypothetical protein